MKTWHQLLDWTQGQPPPSDERHSSSTRRVTTSSTQFHPIGGRRHDRAGPGQIEDEGVEVGVHSRLRHQRRALLELVDIDQPSATALCSRRSVPLRSASETSIAYSWLMSAIALCGQATQATQSGGTGE